MSGIIGKKEQRNQVKSSSDSSISSSPTGVFLLTFDLLLLLFAVTLLHLPHVFAQMIDAHREGDGGSGNDGSRR